MGELEQKVKSATDWRQHYDQNPGAFLAAAVGGGLLLSLMVGQRRRYIHAPSAAQASASTSSGVVPMSGHIRETIGDIKGALVGVAATQAKSFISKLIPGFDEQLARVGKKAEKSMNGA
ncbi:MAG: hypothetical protein M3O26_06020 [Pseudomonadota bacterium]|nr:hypothetical protein [Pseudomonadota bacterium]